MQLDPDPAHSVGLEKTRISTSLKVIGLELNLPALHQR